MTQSKPGEPVERHLSSDQKFREWSRTTRIRPMTSSASRSAGWRTSARCDSRKAKRRGRASGTSSRHCGTRTRRIPISEDFTRQVRQALDNLQDKQGVTVRFIGYTDDAPLTGQDRGHLRRPSVVVEGKGATRRAGHAGNSGIAELGDRKRRSRCITPACLQRNRAGTGVESPHRGGILVRRSSPGVAGGAATLSR